MWFLSDDEPRPPLLFAAALFPSGMAWILSGNARTKSLRPAKSSRESPLTCDYILFTKPTLEKLSWLCQYHMHTDALLLNYVAQIMHSFLFNSSEECYLSFNTQRLSIPHLIFSSLICLLFLMHHQSILQWEETTLQHYACLQMVYKLM